jgi:hypothetical protein
MPERFRGTRGAGLLSAVFGLAFFLAFMLFATQISVRLYASATITDDAYRAARVVAGESVQRQGRDGVAAAMEAQSARLRDRYGALTPEIKWGPLDGDQILLTLTVHPRGELVGGLDGLLGFDTIQRTVRVHREVGP